jgi:hypothetical protein
MYLKADTRITTSVISEDTFLDVDVTKDKLLNIIRESCEKAENK